MVFIGFAANKCLRPLNVGDFVGCAIVFLYHNETGKF